jgi:spore coat protein U-like protein
MKTTLIVPAGNRQLFGGEKTEKKRIDKSYFVRLAVTLILAAGAARAAPSCRNIVANPLNFPAYDVYNATATDTSTTVAYSCPPPTTPAVDISAGGGGSFNPRLMSFGANQLAYNVYVDSTRTQIWGATPVAVPSGNNSTLTVYGRIFALQDVAVGTYTDSLVVTFNF